MRKESPAYQIRYHKLYMSVRYNTVLFPFGIKELAEILPETGYIVREELVSPLPFGASVNVSGSIAHKGDIRLSVNMDRMYIGIDALDLDTLINEMNAIEDLLFDRIGFDSHRSALFYELLAQATIRSPRSPVDVLGSKFRDQPLFGRLSATIGLSSTNFGLRLVPIDASPNQPDWHDIRIEPSVGMAMTHYDISVVFRRTQRSEAMDFATKLPRILDNVLADLEGE